MHLFLVRHGETVDNVAGLYAGSRDSALTAHGVLQARRLATHFADRKLVVKHIFSSNLQRAAKTAEAVLDAQQSGDGGGGACGLVQLPELREKDFGSGEGVKFGMGKTGDRKPHEGAETPEAMRIRADRFLDHYLFPALQSFDGSKDSACVVVAHGLILGSLFKALCARIHPGHLVLSPEVPRAGSDPHAVLPVLPSWSNTGYLHGVLSAPAATDAAGGSGHSRAMLPFRLHVKSVNCVDHLKGLRKTRGGIGSAEFDGKQKSIDSFFGAKAKKRKADEAAS